MRYWADAVVLPDRVLDRGGWVEVEDGLIAAVGQGEPATGEWLGEWLFPGFIDIHCHGGAGYSFTDSPDGARAAARCHLDSGTTTLLASTATAPRDELVEQLAALSGLIAQNDLGQVHGIHVEGPFLNPQYKGAHRARYLTPPHPGAVQDLLEAGRGTVAMMTLAPELPGGQEAITLLVRNGVVAAIGHTAATYEQAREAFQRGASVLTHTCNGMAPIHHRAPGPILAALEAAVAMELILDGIHLHDAMASHLLQAASSQAVLITDAMAAAEHGDGEYELAGLPVTVHAGAARLRDGHSIAGSTLTMDRAVCRALRLGTPPTAVAHASSARPARLLGLDDRGEIRIGQRADLVGLAQVTDRKPITRTVLGGKHWAASRRP